MPANRFVSACEYELDQSTTLGASMVYTDLGDAKIEKAALRGEYDKNRYIMLGFYSKWKW